MKSTNGAAIAAVAAAILAAATLALRMAVAEEATQPEWWDTDQPDCQVWNENPQSGGTATWSGACAGGKAQQRGKLVWSYHDASGKPQTDTYEGRLRDGELDGQDVYPFANGDRYEGQWKNGKQDGQGSYVFAGGARYDGQWKDHYLNGKGLMIYADGKRFEGPVKDGKEHSSGNCVDETNPSAKCELSQGAFIRWLQ